MLKVLVTPLNLMLAGAIALGLTQIMKDTSGVEVRGNVVKLDEIVTSDSTKPLVKELDLLEKSGRKSILLHVTSPGGSVMDGREVNEEIRSSTATVNTLVTNYAMSMGMDFLLQGKERFATPEAVGMIHRGSASGVSYASLKNMLEDLLAVKASGVKDAGLDGQIEGLRSATDAMDVLFSSAFRRLEEIKKTAPNPKKMDELIAALKVGDRDIFLTAQQMLDLGIVTKIVKSVEEAEQLTNENS